MCEATKNGGDGGANPQRTFNRQGAAGLLRRQAQQGQPKPHGSGGAGGGERVGHLGQKFRAHPPPIVRDNDGQPAILVLVQRDVHPGGPGGNGILRHIQQMKREFLHPFFKYWSRMGPTWAG